MFHVSQALAVLRRRRLVEQSVQYGQQILVEQFGEKLGPRELQARRMCKTRRMWRLQRKQALECRLAVGLVGETVERAAAGMLSARYVQGIQQPI